MSDVPSPLLSALRDAPLHQAKGFLLALSGGLDSSALLHAWLACHGAVGLRVVHIDHGLQTESAAWARHCQTLCDGLNLPLVIESLALDPACSNLEAVAREARYGVLQMHLRDGEWLLTAHHQDDQAETFLLRALRGSGPSGLAAMRAWRAFGAGQHWRPWLGIARSDIELYVAQQRIAHITDRSNANLRFDRNFLRQSVLPLLQSRWPRATHQLALSAHWCAEADHALARQDDALLTSLCDEQPGVLPLEDLRVLSVAQRARVLRQWVRQLYFPPLPRASLRAIERDLIPATHDSDARCDWAHVRLQHWRGQLHALRLPAHTVTEFDLCWDGVDVLHLPDGGRLELRAQTSDTRDRSCRTPWTQTFAVRSRRGGERIQLPGRTHHHKLKHLLQQAELPPWQRDQVPLLFAPDGELLAAGDLFLSARLQGLLQACRRELRWVRANGVFPSYN
ncbi:MAG TPA: tRNA lysidine(34) synthetase TilS [Aquimonas sp.]|nr:tRNA lysidine(34) synthetase TilS [Aquimonas sp.]HRF53363.1 tRNA lysidine(34) synthetase TilS [Aquimonas sp.]